ncbi:MAG TPA: GNAT family N-acetyltransferase [Solirubrobacterales bacterium]|nr:GNAT family N-acetyltransferase [Solirubrobacterales bacterium]
MATNPLQRSHLNLLDSSRQFFELDPGAAIEAEPGWLFGAGSSTHPVISNGAFRRDDGVDAAEFVTRAKEFFAARERSFSIWVRGGEAADQDLIAAAKAADFQLVYEMPEMTLGEKLEPPELPPGAELRRLTTVEQANDFWRVAITSYASIGFPPEVFAGYTNHAGLLAENVVAFLALLDGEAVSIAMTMVSHGVAGIYWVGSLERARGKGLGRAVTVAATNAGFDLGADVASLQASPMGKPIYLELGYETAFEYQMWMFPAP